MTSLTHMTVPFHNAELYIVEYEGQPYTPMKPIVDGMGLSWTTQYRKLMAGYAQNEHTLTSYGENHHNSNRWGVTKLVIPTLGDLQEMLCIPLRKVFAWFNSISPNKVKPELRDTVIKYQEECDDVLWDYWTKGKAVNPRPKTHKSERTPLHDAHAMLVAKTKHLNSSDAWKIINQRFGTNSIDEIPYEAIPVAVEYVHHLIALYSSAGKQGGLFDKDTYELVRELTEAILSQNGMMQDVWKALMLINQKDMMYYSNYVIKSNTLARKVGIELDFKTKQGLPLVDGYCQTINFSSGHRLGINPNWFNAPAW